MMQRSLSLLCEMTTTTFANHYESVVIVTKALWWHLAKTHLCQNKVRRPCHCRCASSLCVQVYLTVLKYSQSLQTSNSKQVQIPGWF